MAANLERLPNYTCRETIERTTAAPGARHFSLIDRLRLEVAYVGGRELYAWPGAQKFDDRPIDEIVGGGAAIGNGAFGGHAHVVFTTLAPSFTFGGEEQREGRRIARFNFTVPVEKSRYAIQTGPKPVIVPYHGFLEADAESYAALELAVQGDELPAELKLRSASETVRYAPSKIGGTEFLLPDSSVLTMVGMDGHESRNQTRFERCRQYSGESTIRFDTVDGDGGLTQAAPIEVPSGMQIDARLRDAIAYDTAARGDQVFLVVTSDAKRSGRVAVPKGAVISCRIMRLMSYTVRSSVYFAIALQFEGIEFGGRRGEFPGVVEAVGVGPSYFARYDDKSGESLVSVKATIEKFDAGMRMLIRRK